MTLAFRWPSALNRASRCFDTPPSRPGTGESGFPIVYPWQKRAQTATFRHSRCRPGQCRLNQSPPPPIWIGAMESGKHKLYPLADGCEKRLTRNEAEGRGKEIVANYDSESSHYEPRQLGGADGNRASSLVGNEAQFSEAIHKKTHSGSGCANHFRQFLLRDCRNDQLRSASVAEVT